METSATKKYLDILRKQYNDCSDYRISQLLQVSRQCVSRWSQGKGTIDDEPAARLADMCSLDPLVVLTEIHIERSRSRTTRHYYEEVLKKVSGIHAVVFSGILTLIYPAISAVPMM